MNDEQIKMLQAGLDPKLVSKRKGAGSMELSYLEGHHAIDQANRIFGYDGWYYRSEVVECLGTEKTERGSHQVAYLARVTAGVRDTAGLTERTDVGFGIASDKYSVLAAHELASKEAVTDALKRALRSFGNQFGNSLYQKDNALHSGGKDSKAPSLSQTDSDKLLQTLTAVLEGIKTKNDLMDEMKKAGFQVDAKSLTPEHYGKLKEYANARMKELK